MTPHFTVRPQDGVTKEYLVKWKGYPHSENTWEPRENLVDCPDVLQAFRR